MYLMLFCCLFKQLGFERGRVRPAGLVQPRQLTVREWDQWRRKWDT